MQQAHLLNKNVHIQVRCLFLNDVDFEFTNIHSHKMAPFYDSNFSASDTFKLVLEGLFDHLFKLKVLQEPSSFFESQSGFKSHSNFQDHSHFYDHSNSNDQSSCNEQIHTINLFNLAKLTLKDVFLQNYFLIIENFQSTDNIAVNDTLNKNSNFWHNKSKYSQKELHFKCLNLIHKFVQCSTILEPDACVASLNIGASGEGKNRFNLYVIAKHHFHNSSLDTLGLFFYYYLFNFFRFI